MTETKKEKKLRADRRLGRLIELLEERATSKTDTVAKQAIDRLSEILLAQLELKREREQRAERGAERAHQLRLAQGTAPVDPDMLAKTIRELQAEVALKKAKGEA
jgi:hypothetical protein